MRLLRVEKRLMPHHVLAVRLRWRWDAAEALTLLDWVSERGFDGWADALIEATGGHDLPAKIVKAKKTATLWSTVAPVAAQSLLGALGSAFAGLGHPLGSSAFAGLGHPLGSAFHPAPQGVLSRGVEEALMVELTPEPSHNTRRVVELICEALGLSRKARGDREPKPRWRRHTFEKWAGLPPRQLNRREFLGFPVEGISPGETMTLRVSPMVDCKPLRLVVPSTLASSILILGLRFGNAENLFGEPAPAMFFDEGSGDSFDMPTVQTNQVIELTVQNIGAEHVQFTAGMLVMMRWEEEDEDPFLDDSEVVDSEDEV